MNKCTVDCNGVNGTLIMYIMATWRNIAQYKIEKRRIERDSLSNKVPEFVKFKIGLRVEPIG